VWKLNYRITIAEVLFGNQAIMDFVVVFKSNIAPAGQLNR
jgi:hypothetical protein